MSLFKDIKDSKDFLALDAKRASVLTTLSKLKTNLEKSKENPTLVLFERNEAKLDSKLDQLESVSEVVAEYFRSLGGDTFNDNDFIEYLNAETSLTGEIEILRSSYHELLKSQNLLQPPAPAAPPEEMVTKADLIDALKGLAQSHISVAEKQANAAETQAKALIKSFKSPILDVPSFNPVDCKADPLAWTSFKSKFDHFAKNCVDDESKLSFLFQAVKGDALKIIQGLTCTAENYEPALKLLADEYSRPAAVKHRLLLKCCILR